MPTQDMLDAIDTQPNSELWIGYDNDTVYLNISTNSNFEQIALLIYTSPEYDLRLQDKQKKSTLDDI